MLTWEAPEMIFEMPVRTFSPTRAGSPRAGDRARLRPILRTPLRRRGGHLFLDLRGAACRRDRYVRDGRAIGAVPIGRQLRHRIGPRSLAKTRAARSSPRSSRSKLPPGEFRREEFRRDSSTDRFLSPSPSSRGTDWRRGDHAQGSHGSGRSPARSSASRSSTPCAPRTRSTGASTVSSPRARFSTSTPRMVCTPRRSTRVASVPTTTCAASARTRTPRPSSSVARCTRMAGASDGAGFSRVFDQ